MRDNKVLLLKKSEGLFGQGKWNALGGKILDGEDPRSCAIREVFEETRLRIERLNEVALVHFYKHNHRASPAWSVHVFLSRDFTGVPADGREGITKWFDVNALPFEEMWEDHRYWHRMVFEGKRFGAWFYYSGDFEKLIDHRIEDRPSISVKT